MLKLINALSRVLRQLTLTVGSAACLVMLSTGISFAASGPTAYPGETMKIYAPRYVYNSTTDSYQIYSTQGLSVQLSPAEGGSALQYAQLTYVGSYHTTYNEFRFTVPRNLPLGTDSAHILVPTSSWPYSELLVPGFVGYPLGVTQADFTVTSPPAGQLPEVRYAVVLPLMAFAVWGVLQVRRPRHTS